MVKKYTEKELIRNLERDLRSEFKIIEFYLDNLEKLNYKRNRKKIDELVSGSFRHAALITKELILLKKKKSVGKRPSKQLLGQALKEEFAVREIYMYQSDRAADKDVMRLLGRLIAEEEEHAKIVKSLK